MGLESLAFIMLASIVVSIVIGIPVAFALGGIPLLFGYYAMGARVFNMFSMQAFGMLTDYTFVAAPLFIFMGALLERSGMAENLFEAFYHLLGKLRGGLAIATIAMATIFGACTGIVGAGVITIGLLALPSMLSRGYSKYLATGSIMVGGGLGVTIPPSIMLIIYGSVAGVSISKMFMGAIIPGVAMGFLYMLYVAIVCFFKPELGPPVSDTGRIRGKSLFLFTFRSLIPPLFLILAVMGSIFFGVVSPSEAGAMGCLGALILTIASGRLSFSLIKDSVTSTMKITTAVLLICLAGKLFTGVFMGMRGGMAFSKFLTYFQFGPLGTMLLMLVIIFLMGMIMDWIALVFIFVPIFSPVIRQLGIDPLYFGILFCLTLQISNITPPFAYSVFFLKTICPPEITIRDLYIACVPFALTSAVIPLIGLLFPAFITFLPMVMR